MMFRCCRATLYLLMVVLPFVHEYHGAVAIQQPAAGVAKKPSSSPSRRSFLFETTAITGWLVAPRPSWARGLVNFPCKTPLSNTYHLMRAGTSMLEEEGILSTNPLFLTNREDALSPLGQEQVVAACESMKLDARSPTLVKYSLAARCIDTSNLVSRELRLGSDRLVPEFTFMDPRGIGAWDMSAQEAVLPALYALDYDEAGNDGMAGRPPANEDGTPHESLSDQAVRLRQVLSILESQYAGETILLIFPDGTSPALLSTMVAGIPFRHVHELEYQPGEVRFDVTMDSTLALWKQRKDRPEYWTTIEKGRTTLSELRDPNQTESSSSSPLLDLKTKKLQQERLAIDAEQAEMAHQKALADAERDAVRQQRYHELEQQRMDQLRGVAEGKREALRQRRYNESEHPKSNNPRIPLAGSAGMVVLSAIAGAMNRPQEPSATATDQSTKDGIAQSPAGVAPLLSESFELQDRKQTAIMEDIASSLPSTKKVSDPVLSTRQKEEAASAAMDDYMNRDDGLSDWLKSLNEIIEDDEEEMSDPQP